MHITSGPRVRSALSSLKRLERRPGADAQTVRAVRMAPGPAGVEFTKGGAPGVKLVRRMKEPAQ
jgi:hypothetical protein